MLRQPAATATLEQLTEQHFHFILDDPKAVDAIYFFLSAGLGDLKIEYTDVLGNTGFVTERFRVTTGMHQRWYHLANFANGGVELIFFDEADTR